eukprot:352424-Chlamydomonas_euryale.AAC.1
MMRMYSRCVVHRVLYIRPLDKDPRRLQAYRLRGQHFTVKREQPTTCVQSAPQHEKDLSGGTMDGWTDSETDGCPRRTWKLVRRRDKLKKGGWLSRPKSVDTHLQVRLDHASLGGRISAWQLQLLVVVAVLVKKCGQRASDMCVGRDGGWQRKTGGHVPDIGMDGRCVHEAAMAALHAWTACARRGRGRGKGGIEAS